MKLARDVTRDADTCGCRAGVGHGSRYVRCSIVGIGHCGGDGTTAAGWVAQTQILNEAGEGHVCGLQTKDVRYFVEVSQAGYSVLELKKPLSVQTN